MQKNEEQGLASSSDVEHLIKRLDDFEMRLKRIEDRFVAEPARIAKALSIREFLIEKQPKSDVEKTFIIGYYLETLRNLGSFNTRDLGDGFREAKENIPANINLAVIGNVQKGYFMEAKEKKESLKAWTLTNSGISYFERPDTTNLGAQ